MVWMVVEGAEKAAAEDKEAAAAEAGEAAWAREPA